MIPGLGRLEFPNRLRSQAYYNNNLRAIYTPSTNKTTRTPPITNLKTEIIKLYLFIIDILNQGRYNRIEPLAVANLWISPRVRLKNILAFPDNRIVWIIGLPRKGPLQIL